MFNTIFCIKDIFVRYFRTFLFQFKHIVRLLIDGLGLALLRIISQQNPLTGLNFQGTGTLASPMGAKLLRTPAMPSGTMIGLDKNYALEHICGSEVMVEYDKLIDRQLERAAITSIAGFAKPYQEASKVLELS